MANYRIVRAKGYADAYLIQKKILGWFWIAYDGGILYHSIKTCEEKIKWIMNWEKIKKDNPKNVVIKEY